MKTNADAVVTAATSTGRYRRVGDSAEVIIQTKFSSTPSTGASWYHWTLPAGLVIDTAKQTTGGPTIGAGAASGTSVNQQTDLNIYVRTSSTVSAGGTGFWYVNDSTPLTFAANFQFDLYFTVPIVGWTTTQ
jgi:hypothetical protein